MAAHTVTPTFQLHHRLGLALEWADIEPEEMAEELGMHVNSVHNYVAGRRTPKRAVLVAWALRTGAPIEWLETGEVSATATDGQFWPKAYDLPLFDMAA